jgi:predicted nucleic acid-binding protein
LNLGLDLIEVDRLFAFLIRHSEIVRPNHWFKIVQDDPDDDKFIDCAFHAQANTIISGDKHLLRLKKFGPIEIMSAAEFKRKNPEIFRKV